MKKSSKMGKSRGASLVEYAMLLFSVLLIAAGTIKLLGPKVAEAGAKGVNVLNENTQ